MRKLSLLLILTVVGAISSYAQVVFSVQTPSNLVGSYGLSVADPAGGWGTPDMNLSANSVTAPLMFGAAPGGDTTACVPALDNLTGKIGVIYRGTCEFGAKALAVQNKGAVACIIINNVGGGVIAMGPGADGANVTIPLIMISSIDGQNLRNAIVAGTVTGFIGNKFQLFTDDLGARLGDVLRAKNYATPVALAKNASEFSVGMGSWVHNFGSASQTGATLAATITLNGITIYSQSASVPTIASGDSILVNLPLFSQPSYSVGKYVTTYTIATVNTDGDLTDNSVTSNFMINNDQFSYGRIDETTHLPLNPAGSRAGTFTTNWEGCVHFQNPNASRMQALGMTFSSVTNAGDSLTGETAQVEVYKWDDAFTDLNDAAFGFNTLNLLTSTFYQYNSDLQDSNIYQPYDAPITLIDNQRYLFCLNSFSQKSFAGYDNQVDYTATQGVTAQPSFPGSADGAYTINGFGLGTVPALAIKMVAIDPCDNFATAAAVTNVDCPGAANGAVTLNTSGGTTPYSYSWSNGVTTSSLTNMSGAALTFTVTDAGGCTALAGSTTITEPTNAPLATTPAFTDAICLQSNGTAVISTSAGVSPYTYTWSNAATTASISGLAAGNYDVTITDNIGCSNIENITITDAPALSISVTTANASACGATDGTVTLAITGNSPYTYSWSNSATTMSLTGLAASTYTATVTDVNGCTETASTNVGNTGSTLVLATSVTAALCWGNATGTATSIASGSTTYTYAWNAAANSQTTATATGLMMGTYDVVVTDNVGCVDFSSVTISQPSTLMLTVTSTIPTCNGDVDGSATVVGAGGTVPYSYSWSNSATTSTIALGAGVISASITDANGCATSVTSVTIADPSAVATTISGTNPLCNGNANGTAVAMGSGGAGSFTYLWSDNQVSATATGLVNGTMSVTVSDSKSCSAIASITLTEPSALVISGVVNDATNLGSIITTVTGGTVSSNSPYTYNWTCPAACASLLANQTNLNTPGTYSVTVTDNNLCTTFGTYTVAGVVSVNELSNGGEVKLYPNPTRGKFTIEMTNLVSDNYQLDVKNVLGQIVYLKQFNVSGSKLVQVDLSKFEGGMYIVTVGNSTSKTIQRVIVK